MMEQVKIKGGLTCRKHSQWWYGQYKIDGKRYVKNLRVEIRGTPPDANEEHGSIQYEKSRSTAEASLNNLLIEINRGKDAEDLAQAVHEARTGGRRVKVYDLANLGDLWEQMPRSKPVSDSHHKISLAWINGFVSYCNAQLPTIKKLDHLAPEHARQFMDWQEERGISPRTWNAILGTLRAACRRGKCSAFDDLRQKASETVHRVPYSPDELEAIFNEARGDELLYPLVVMAACTAMRRGDCCNLKWSAVDLSEGFLSVKTSKTGRSVDIPIADILRKVISGEVGNGSEYVFPSLAQQYTNNPRMLTDRLRKVLARIGYHDGKPRHLGKLAEYDPEQLASRAEDYFSAIPTEQKQEKARAMFKAYTKGNPLCRSAESVGISRATGSSYLNEIEAATGIAFIRGKRREKVNIPPRKGDVHVNRAKGIRRASVRDFHSFRTTWITLALCSGIPFELVQKVTGHATAEIVMEHYFKPQRAQLKEALGKSMPSLLTASNYNPVDTTIELLRQMNGKNWKKLRDEALETLGSE